VKLRCAFFYIPARDASTVEARGTQASKRSIQVNANRVSVTCVCDDGGAGGTLVDVCARYAITSVAGQTHA